jgi:enoyl-CoA hydratase/carnithine racemase
MTGDPAVLSEAADGVLTVTLNRPEARNAVNRQLAGAVAAALEGLDADDDLRVGVITGAGGTFCSGMDLKAFAAGERPTVAGRGFAGIAQRAARKPLIAAVEGYALAGGFEVALACDLIVAARDARFGIPEVKRGLVAAAGGLLRLPRRIPYHLAMELALTGEPVDAPRAKELGIVNRLAEPGRRWPRRTRWRRQSRTTRRRAERLQGDRPARRRVDRERGLAAPGRDRAPRVRLRGRAGGARAPSPRNASRAGGRDSDR